MGCRVKAGDAARGTDAEEGSVLLLVLGYVLLALAVIFVCACATDLYIAQKRLDALADAAALAGTDGFVLTVQGQTPRAELTDEAVAAQARPLVDGAGGNEVLVSATSPDGASARVTVRTAWHPPLVSPFVPEGLTLQATATSRTALR